MSTIPYAFPDDDFPEVGNDVPPEIAHHISAIYDHLRKRQIQDRIVLDRLQNHATAIGTQQTQINALKVTK